MKTEIKKKPKDRPSKMETLLLRRIHTLCQEWTGSFEEYNERKELMGDLIELRLEESAK